MAEVGIRPDVASVEILGGELRLGLIFGDGLEVVLTTRGSVSTFVEGNFVLLSDFPPLWDA